MFCRRTHFETEAHGNSAPIKEQVQKIQKKGNGQANSETNLMQYQNINILQYYS